MKVLGNINVDKKTITESFQMTTTPQDGYVLTSDADGNGTWQVATGGSGGSQGPTGPQGPAGNDGADGSDGATGPQGSSGATGAQGIAGADGQDGTDGAHGAQGATGPQGPAGNDGADGSNKKYAQDITFTGDAAKTITHSLNEEDVIVQLKDSTGKMIIPDLVNTYTVNSVAITVSETGTYRVIIIG